MASWRCSSFVYDLRIDEGKIGHQIILVFLEEYDMSHNTLEMAMEKAVPCCCNSFGVHENKAGKVLGEEGLVVLDEFEICTPGTLVCTNWYDAQAWAWTSLWDHMLLLTPLYSHCHLYSLYPVFPLLI